MKMKRISLILALIISVCCAAAESDELRLKSWTIQGEVERYQTDNLWELINGAAEVILSYGFQDLRAFECSAGPLRFMVQVYRMESPLSAFGIYRSENPPLEDSFRIGAEAQFSDYLAVMLTGNCYVKVETIRDKAVYENCATLLEELCQALGGGDGFPDEFSLLPQTDMIPQSQGYIHENFLGVEELHHVLFARYRSGTAAYRLFVVTGCRAGAFMASLPGGWDQSGIEKKTQIRIREIPYIGPVALAVRGGIVSGIVDVRDRTLLAELFGNWMERVEERQGDKELK